MIFADSHVEAFANFKDCIEEVHQFNEEYAFGTRSILLPRSTAELLRNRKKSAVGEWIFHHPVKPEHPMPSDAAYGRMKILLKQADLPSIRFHDLRHSYVKPTLKIF